MAKFNGVSKVICYNAEDSIGPSTMQGGKGANKFQLTNKIDLQLADAGSYKEISSWEPTKLPHSPPQWD